MHTYRITKRGKVTIYILITLITIFMVNSALKVIVKANKSIPIISKNYSTSSNLDYKNNSTIEAVSMNLKLKNKALVISTSSAIEKQADKNNEPSYPVEDAYIHDGKKIAFLTFDDGPSRDNTLKILDILKIYHIKANFFIIGSCAEKNKSILKEIVAQGHIIGNHTYSHKYDYIYSSVSNFIAEIKRTDKVFADILGNDFHSRIIRFPGGSFDNKMQPYKNELFKEGYTYIDWNTIIGDGHGTNIPADKLFSILKATIGKQQHIVVLMHDSPTKQTTVEALPRIIQYLKEKGYKFATLR